MKTVIVFLADGFEECEGLLAVDLLRRAKVNVVTASVSGRREVLSSHQVTVTADLLAEEADYAAADMVVLPGGMPGTLRLGECALVRDQCLAFAKDRYVAAICAAPSILADLGLLEGREATCHPNFEDKMAGAAVTKNSVTAAGNLITGQGLGSAIPFALELVRTLTDDATAEQIASAICYPPKEGAS